MRNTFCKLLSGVFILTVFPTPFSSLRMSTVKPAELACQIVLMRKGNQKGERAKDWQWATVFWNLIWKPGTCVYVCVCVCVCIYITEKAMASHSSTLAWKIPWTEEPGGLQSMGSLRVGHDWVTSLSLSLFTFMHWRRKWQPTPVFLPGESQGWGSLVGCRLWGRTELHMTKVT